MSWRLRKSDGTIYGPVEFPDLYRWATEGRVLPDDFVAEGDGEWVPAPSVAALELDWLLPRGESVIGPLHLLAYAELLQERALSGGEPIVKKSGGDPIPVGQAVAEALLRRAAIARAQSQDAGLREKLEAAERAREELSREVVTLKAELAAAREELSRLRARLDEATARADAARGELAQALAQNEQLAERERAEAERSANLQGMLDREREAAAQQQAESAERLRAAEQEIEALKARMKEQEAHFKEVVRDFRELNDRYVRLRNQIETVSADGKPRVRLA
jgi:uncharacterized protein YdcH (DUF465 family)